MIRLLSDRLEQHFPTMVMVREHGGMEKLNSDLTQVIAGLDIELGKTSRNAATNGDSTTRDGFQTPADMAFLDLDQAAVKVLKAQIILPGIEEYLSQVFHADPYTLISGSRAGQIFWARATGRARISIPRSTR